MDASAEYGSVRVPRIGEKDEPLRYARLLVDFLILDLVPVLPNPPVS